MSKIEWTDVTWSPVTGCAKVSDGCKNCYAEKMHARLGKMNSSKYTQPFSVVRCHPFELERPARWKKPRRIFVCSMADLFHKDVPWKFIAQVFDVINAEYRHAFQVLTKRPDRMSRLIDARKREGYPTMRNCWLGTSIENQKAVFTRMSWLTCTPAAIRFLSVEPLLGPVDLGDLRGIHQVIVGGESGPNARPMNPDWVRSIRDQCQAQGVPFFFKQWGGTGKKEDVAVLDGKVWQEFPVEASRL